MSEIQHNLWLGWETVRLICHGSFGAVYEISSMLSRYSSLTELDVSGFDLSKATKKDGFFISDGVVRYTGY